MSKKLIKIFLIFALVSIATQNNYITNSYQLNAGIIKWGVKKVISVSLNIIFSSTKDAIIEYNKKKIVKFLEKHPQYIAYTIDMIKKQILKHPKLQNRGINLLDYLIKKLNLPPTSKSTQILIQ